MSNSFNNNSPSNNEAKYYYSYTFSNDKVKSKYQLALQDYLKSFSKKYILKCLDNIFLNQLFNRIEKIEEFLDFHYDEFSGSKLQFLRRTEENISQFFNSLNEPQEGKIIVNVRPFIDEYTKLEYTHYKIVLEYYKIWNKQKKEQFYKKNQRKEIPASPKDDRIECNASIEEIEDYFNQLSKCKDNNNQPIMTKEEIATLLASNFSGFEAVESMGKFTPNANQANLKYFVYRFYNKHSQSSHDAGIYAMFLKNNFTQFNNIEITTIKKSFSRKPAKYYLP